MIYINLANDIQAIVSNEDAELAKKTWSRNSSQSDNTYARHNWKRGGKRGSILLHRAVMERALGRPLEPHEIIDHINRNKLDNRRENLRLASYQLNRLNSEQQSSRVNKYIGVTWSKSANKYIVRCRGVYGGLFTNEEEAGRAYDKMALELYGEYAEVNFTHEA